MQRITILFITLLSLHIVAYASFPVSETSNIVSEECDNIILKDGGEISVNIIEITPDLIKYRRCNQKGGPIVSLNKSDVMMVRYADGTKDIFTSNNSKVKSENNDLKGNGFAVVALVCGIAGFIVPFAGLVAIVFGAIGLKRKGKGMAVTGMILGVINLILVIILLSLA